MYVKTKDTEFGLGRINDVYIIAPVGEFRFGDNRLEDTISFVTYKDDQTGIVLYDYKDKLVTIKELRREYLKDYYNVK